MGKFDPAKMKEFVPERPNGGLREQDLIMLADLRALHLGVVEREYRFEPTRRWRVDFVISARWVRLAVELEGGIHVQGRHNRGAGMQSDLEKYQELVAAGWTLFRFSTEDVLNGRARDVLKRWAAWFRSCNIQFGRAGLER
jgi:very-short-patch-repair endonuclease